MGFFSKLFGNKEEKPDTRVDLPVQSAVLKGIASLNLSEILEPKNRELYAQQIRMRDKTRADQAYFGSPDDDVIVDRLKVRYEFGFDYVVEDEKLLKNSIGEDDLNEALSELFYVCISEIDAVSVKVIEGDTADYAENALDRFNSMCGDWGVKGRKMEVKSIAPVDEEREFYEAYKAVWG